MSNISLKGLDKAKVLAALYNASKPQGLGFLHYDSQAMTVLEAKSLLKEQSYFDYLKGRVMKVDLSGDELNPWGYDRDNGAGAAAAAIASLLSTDDVNNEVISKGHSDRTFFSAIDAEGKINEKSELHEDGTSIFIGLGFSEFKEELEPKIKKAKKESME